MNRCVIIGAGGHGKVVVDALLRQGLYQPAALTDSNHELKGTTVLGIPVVGGDEQLQALLRQGIKHFAIGVGSVADNLCRKRLFAMASECGLIPVTVVHPSAVIATSATIGQGSVVLAGAIINPDAVLGENVIVNTGAIVEHDCVVESHVHLCPGVRVGGGVQVGEGSFVGAGSLVKQNLRIGRWAVVGMGSLVIRSVDMHSVVAGAPAKTLEKKTVL